MPPASGETYASFLRRTVRLNFFPPTAGAIYEIGAVVRQLLTTPIQAGRHLAIWLVWQSTRVTLVCND